jgi:hypothetical protein
MQAHFIAKLWHLSTTTYGVKMQQIKKCGPSQSAFVKIKINFHNVKKHGFFKRLSKVLMPLSDIKHEDSIPS